MCLDSIQGVITKTTWVWSELSGDKWITINDIHELHAFLSFSQSGGNVSISLLDLMEQGDRKSDLPESERGSKVLQDQSRDYSVE